MRIAAVVPLLFLLVPAAHAGEPPGGYYENAAWGFKLRVPKDWREVPSDQKWIASKHLGKRELEAQRGAEYWTRESPELWVVGFPHAGAEVANPYDGYLAYLERDDGFVNFADGYSIAGEKETTVGDAKVTMYDIRQAPDDGVPHRVVAWVFHFDDIDFAVQFKVLEWHYDDYDSSFRGCLKSFRRIERTESLAGPAAAGATGLPTREEIMALPPEKRIRAIKDAVEVRLRHEVEVLPEGWKDQRTKQFLVVSNADRKFVRAALQHAEAVESHIDDIFGMAAAEYEPPAVLRIFAGSEEKDAYGEGDGGGAGFVREIVIAAGHGWEKDNAWEELNRNLLSQWLVLRHPELEKTLPEWLKDGLDKYMNMVRTKGRRISYANDDWDRDEIRLQIKKGAYEDVHALLTRDCTDEGTPSKNLDKYERERQVRVVVLWLMRDANRGKTKNLVGNLVLAVATEIERVEQEWLKANPKQKTVDAGVVAGKRAEIRRAAWQRVFRDWDDDDWKRLHNAWLGDAK